MNDDDLLKEKEDIDQEEEQKEDIDQEKEQKENDMISRNFKPHTHQLENILPTNNNINTNNNITDFEVVNDWTRENYNTVKRWQDDIEKSSLVHSEILNNVFNSLQNVLIACLVVGAFITLFSALSVTLSFLNHKWTSIVFNIAILICGGAITIMMGIIKIANWENLVLMLSKVVEKLDNIWFAFDTELGISPDQRINAKDFIKRYDGEYMFVMRQQLPITVNTYNAANRKYKERLADDHMWMLNFRRQMKRQLENNELTEIKIE